MTTFRDTPLPEPGAPEGYAALIDQFGLRVPFPPRMTAIAMRHHPVSTERWRMLTPRHAPPATLAGRLGFALKWEGVDLGVLSALFQAAPAEAIADVVRARPTGAYARRLWFLYEWLTGRALDLPHAGKVRAVPVLSPDQQFALAGGAPSRRHRVIDNLPGTPAFCPLVRRTPRLDQYAARGLDGLARQAVDRVPANLLGRAAAFLMLSDSQSSFAIEGERPSAQRAARWGEAIAGAGMRDLTLSELERLQRLVIGDARFVRLGLRQRGGFVGRRDRDTGEPIPDHVSARPEDLPGLMAGLIAYANRTAGRIDPVAAAAAIAFGFVYVHPFEDGNGRVHRWLIHDTLARAAFGPPGVVFPVSAAILRHIAPYRDVLESYSRPLLDLIDYRPTPDGNVTVVNKTAPFYRYFDATAHAEFLYKCIAETIDADLPDEVSHLQAFDRFVAGVRAIADMPSGMIDLLNRFLRQGGGRLSRRARDREFSALTDGEAAAIERLHAEVFGAAAADAARPIDRH